ncbi:DUF4406 domain-containing protein [Alicyclobacillus shizuokensis]|uniref:DUF4406 domain-containing protein n=1 Tax=Alicyclobacillus shizuokensis TaxID=392014 RepID=UPI00082BCDA4|nr:DUF4406 domain-containing protein [Alicyclobacillus shizuokensis]
MATKIYISGPMSGMENYNYEAFFAAEERLNEKGYEVINPARLGYVEGWSWEDYLRRDIKAMLDADAVVVLPNWLDSKGARLEILVASKLGMPIYDEETMEELDVQLVIAIQKLERKSVTA